jgi:membrane protease YdiL (CAAX protease family)
MHLRTHNPLAPASAIQPSTRLYRQPSHALALLALSGAALASAVLAPMPLAPTALITLLLIAPVAEELVFRAGLQEALLRRLRERAAVGMLLANLLTAGAFTAAHVALHPSVQALLTAVPALLIGRVYQRHRRVAPCIALHTAFNALWLLRAGIAP